MTINALHEIGDMSCVFGCKKGEANQKQQLSDYIIVELQNIRIYRIYNLKALGCGAKVK